MWTWPANKAIRVSGSEAPTPIHSDIVGDNVARKIPILQIVRGRPSEVGVPEAVADMAYPLLGDLARHARKFRFHEDDDALGILAILQQGFHKHCHLGLPPSRREGAVSADEMDGPELFDVFASTWLWSFHGMSAKSPLAEESKFWLSVVVCQCCRHRAAVD